MPTETGAPLTMATSDVRNSSSDCGGLLPYVPGRDDEPALIDGATCLARTRARLRDEASRAGEALASSRKSLVFVVVEPGPGAIVAVLAAASAGHAVALIDGAMSGTKLEALLDAYRPEIVLGGDPARLSFLSDRGYTAARPLADGVVATQRDGGRISDVDIDPSLFLLLATSGTTGVPRFVRLSRAAVLANAAQISKVVDVGFESVGVAHLPIHYSYGWSVVASHFVAGASVVTIAELIMSKTFWETIARANGSHFPGVPFHYATLARLGVDLIPECVTTFTQAGGALDLKTQARMHAFANARGAKFFVMYGQTEAAPRMTTLPHSYFEAKAGSVGLALEGGRIAIERDGATVAVGETGDVVYTGPNVMLGYAESREDLAKGDEMHGRLETGDVGRLDADGCLFLTGRTKRFAKIAGLRLGLDQMEKEFAPAGLVACIDGGDSIFVFYDDAAEPALRARARDIAIEYKIPAQSFRFKPIAVLPRTTGGKIAYNVLKEFAGV